MRLDFVKVKEGLLDVDRKLLERSLARDPRRTYTVEHILEQCESGGMQFWRLTGEDEYGIFVTQINDWPTGRELFIVALAGTGVRDVWHPLQKKAEEVARLYECKVIRAEVTNVKLFPITEELGYRLVGGLFEKGV